MIGTLFVIAAPSGAGKTSLVKALVASMDKLKVSISHTTRVPRPTETNGVNYYFVTETEFAEQIKKTVFLEHAFVFGHHYGTSRHWVESQLKAGIDVILEIDWQGAKQVRRLFPASISIFILPPSLEVLKARLEARQEDEAIVIQERLNAAKDEISHCQEFDYLIVNDDFAHALTDLQMIVHCRRLRRDYQQETQAKLLAQLLETK
jgi:guanylate kinase